LFRTRTEAKEAVFEYTEGVCCTDRAVGIWGWLA